MELPLSGLHLYFSLALVGIAVGSFLNVCIHRLPKDESVAQPASHCPICGAPIRWYDNLPLVSFLLLRGRCRACGGRIAWRYPVVELLTGALFLLTVWRFGFGIRPVFLLIFIASLIVVTWIDLDHEIIPHAITLPGIILGLVASLITRDPSPADAATGALVGAGLVYLVAVYAEVAFQRESMGGGDVNLLAMIGAFLGWRLMLFAFFSAVASGAVLSLGLIAARVLSRKDRIPFGPFLALGAIVALFVGDEVID
ncbi:MAG: prepilin peptidase, partial [candidate division NC10 bacterium]|nr:prepilin peptidase [candidate division NC10 bacterium]